MTDKRSYTPPHFFTEGGRLFAEFEDGTLYGVRTRVRWTPNGVEQSRQYIRIERDDTPRTPA
jgi:hypothetical protein